MGPGWPSQASRNSSEVGVATSLFHLDTTRILALRNFIGAQGLGFRVYRGFGFGVWGLGFSGGLGLRVLGFRAYGAVTTCRPFIGCKNSGLHAGWKGFYLGISENWGFVWQGDLIYNTETS